MSKIFVKLIRIYQKFFSPLFPRRCRFYPTCSQYAIEVFEKYGFFRGFFKTFWRIIRCNPFFPGGYDPS
ncbi:membrane protein insertion efficiency factor YidD [Bacillota bacterium LX-D]|nr:membrane protein insertion efficiency factor YidD [Bacillota bacterium LX-D]